MKPSDNFKKLLGVTYNKEFKHGDILRFINGVIAIAVENEWKHVKKYLVYKGFYFILLSSGTSYGNQCFWGDLANLYLRYIKEEKYEIIGHADKIIEAIQNGKI